VEDEAKGKGVIAERAAKVTADKIRSEGEKAAKKIIDEADAKAKSVIDKAKVEAAKIESAAN
jgi:cell division septum initiation protein DivIVA